MYFYNNVKFPFNCSCYKILTAYCQEYTEPSTLMLLSNTEKWECDSNQRSKANIFLELKKSLCWILPLKENASFGSPFIVYRGVLKLKTKNHNYPVNFLYIVFLRFAKYLIRNGQSIQLKPVSKYVTNQESRDVGERNVYTNLTET